MFCSGAQACTDGILFDVMQVLNVVLFVLDAVFFEASFPNVEWTFELEREASLDVLHGLFKRDFFGGREEQVDVVGHDDVGVELEAVFLAVVVEYS